MGAVVTPFDGSPSSAIPLVDFGEEIPRCTRCRAYVNRFFEFVNGGRHFVCNLCGSSGDVPEAYFSRLDGSGKRKDLDSRPELLSSTVDFKAPSSMKEISQETPYYILYLVEATIQSRQNGVLQLVLSSLSNAVRSFRLSPNVQIGFMAFNESVYLFDLNKNTDSLEIKVISDLENLHNPLPLAHQFIPLGSEENRERLIQLISGFEKYLGKFTASRKSCFGSAIETTKTILSPNGGKVCVMFTSPCNHGPYSVIKEKAETESGPPKNLYKPLAEEIAKESISVSLFLCTDMPVNLQTIRCLCESSAGNLYRFPVRQRTEELQFTLEKNIVAEVNQCAAYNSVVVVRCSTGLKIDQYIGNFSMHRMHEIKIPSLYMNKAFALKLKHEDDLDPDRDAAIQIAILYTDVFFGDLRVRVHTHALKVSSCLQDFYGSLDITAIFNISLKQAATRSLQSQDVVLFKKNLVSACVQILYLYRKHSAKSNLAERKLVLPEHLQLLPLFTLSLVKNAVISQQVELEEQQYLSSSCMSFGCLQSSCFLYSHLVEIKFDEQKNGFIVEIIYLSLENLNMNNSYLLYNGVRSILLRGAYAQHSDPEGFFVFLKDLLDGDEQLSIMHRDLICAELNDNVLDDINFRRIFVEDATSFVTHENPETMSYSDFMSYVQKSVQENNAE